MKRFFYLFFIQGTFLLNCSGPVTNYEYPFRDPSLSVDARVKDLVSQLSLEEKVSQLNYEATAIDRLAIPAYNWWNECLHGVGRAGLATVFPQAIGMAASWNRNLMSDMGNVISDEARAKYNEFQKIGRTDIYYGLTFWTPNINIFRDPRWGRGQETYGEDPFLTAGMAVPFIKALQGNDEKYLKVVATAKHFAVHSGPEHSRHSINLDVDNIDLWETYLPAFEATVKDADVASIMCAYNRFRDEACCGSNLLLQNILRDKWGFKGYVVSDCWAITDFYRENAHNLTDTPEEAAALAFTAGTDLNCGVTSPYLVEAVKKGLIDEQAIDAILVRLFSSRIRLGMFDPPGNVPFNQIDYSIVRSEAHKEKALQASRESIVLLKNDHILPLKDNLKNMAVLGPQADDYRILLGNYHGSSDQLITPLDGLKEYLKEKGTSIHYSPGCSITKGVPILTPIPTSHLRALDGESEGLNASYFNNIDFEGKANIERIDPAVNFSWHDKTPVSGIMSDRFGVRWEGFIVAPETGDYTIGINACNSAKLFIDDSLRISFENIHHPLQQSFDITLEKGKKYAIKIDFYSYMNDPQARLLWGQKGIDYTRDALEKVKKSDVVVMFLGLSPYLEGEEMPIHVEGFSGGDRTDIQLPATQRALLEKVVKTGKPVILVLMGGSSISVKYADQHVPAILHAWYPGEFGGKAIAEILFGEYNPSGKLPVTFYNSVDDLPDFEDYSMTNRTYKYFKGTPLYPFGHGLSYSKFEYSDLAVTQETFENFEDVQVKVKVKNIGKVDGAEVVQLYINDTEASYRVPNISLKGFEKVFLESGEEKEIVFRITENQFAIINDDGNKIVEPGSFRLYIGGKQPNMTGNADNPTTMILSTEVKYTGPLVNIN